MGSPRDSSNWPLHLKDFFWWRTSPSAQSSARRPPSTLSSPLRGRCCPSPSPKHAPFSVSPLGSGLQERERERKTMLMGIVTLRQRITLKRAKSSPKLKTDVFCSWEDALTGKTKTNSSGRNGVRETPPQIWKYSTESANLGVRLPVRTGGCTGRPGPAQREPRGHEGRE